jgi:hypothetical protein
VRQADPVAQQCQQGGYGRIVLVWPHAGGNGRGEDEVA